MSSHSSWSWQKKSRRLNLIGMKILRAFKSWRECIQPSWICASDAQTHHFFLSHRQYSEAQFVDKIYGRLNGQYHPFWDQMCIKEGQRWVSEFITGLFCSRIAVLFCSEEAMKKFHRAEKQPDNFLLEWELCLEIVESKETPLQIFVVFVGQVEEVVGRKSGLSQIDLRSFNFEAFGANNFSEGKHCHPLSPRKYTIRQIVEKIFEFQGLPGDPRPGKSNMLVDALLKSAAKLTAPPTGEVVLSAKSESALFRELRQWLHPLDMAMRHHKDRLLDKHVAGTRKWLLDKLTGRPLFCRPPGRASVLAPRCCGGRKVCDGSAGSSVLRAAKPACGHVLLQTRRRRQARCSKHGPHYCLFPGRLEFGVFPVALQDQTFYPRFAQ
ncbi:hypothetical protein DFJ73DRAFT_910834 [Zopfochytrium polystomum]|nr:hypothetical protein DFJ73DRAFT_910834 [Zopfochytrium polystomum]